MRPDAGSPLGLPGASPFLSLPGAGLSSAMAAAAAAAGAGGQQPHPNPGLFSQYYQMMAEKLWGSGGAAGAGMVSPPGSDSSQQSGEKPGGSLMGNGPGRNNEQNIKMQLLFLLKKPLLYQLG